MGNVRKEILMHAVVELGPGDLLMFNPDAEKPPKGIRKSDWKEFCERYAGEECVLLEATAEFKQRSGFGPWAESIMVSNITAIFGGDTTRTFAADLFYKPLKKPA